MNGVNTAALSEMIATIKTNPEIARFEFRARNEWLGGDSNRTTIKEFSGGGAIHRQGSAGFEALSGEHQVLFGQDKAPNPIEWLLHSLVGCMTTTLAYQSASRGILIEAIDSTIAGNIDLRGFLGLSDKVRTGCSNIRVNMRVKSDASPIVLKSLAKLSPVFDVVARSVPVDVTIASY
ncbi:MAG: OsmC family protein [Pseudolabrys sp.]